MQAPSSSIIELRQLLAERFPQARMGLPRIGVSLPTVSSGVGALDDLMGGGLLRGEFTELVGIGDGSGSAQVLHALLRRVAADGQYLALVDGADSFDVDAEEPDVLAHLLWARCTTAAEAFKAADLLLRDRNFPLVVIDLKLNPVAQLRRIPPTTWYRFARLIEHHQTTVLVVTPFQLVSGAACRVGIESKLGLESLSQPLSEVVKRLRFNLMRAVSAAGEEPSEKVG
jgi:hypothetical protein